MKRTRSFMVIVEQDEAGFYVASVPELPGCHTQAKSRNQLEKRIREAIELCLEEKTDSKWGAERRFVALENVAVPA